MKNLIIKLPVGNLTFEEQDFCAKQLKRRFSEYKVTVFFDHYDSGYNERYIFKVLENECIFNKIINWIKFKWIY